MVFRNIIHWGLLLFAIGGTVAQCSADDFDQFLRPLLSDNCARCHGGAKVNGDINLKQITTAQQLLDQPALLENMIEVVGANDMPPETEPALEEGERTKLLATLRTMLRESTAGAATKRSQIRRLNRFQYNNAVRDLFRLNRDLFPLPEKLMTRHGNYLLADKQMPDKVQVSCRSLNPEGGLKDVNAFPKDLRAAHGFDNQANQLTLSPLLLDAFLKLSVSIVESPDFTAETVGIWNDFFEEPTAASELEGGELEGGELETEIKKRLAPFLGQAFRGPVDNATLDRYTAYALAKIGQGMSFTDSMKKVASAALSSPLFLYRYGAQNKEEANFELASNLSFFLWGSGPDEELLRLAESGELSDTETLNRTVDRMLADPKVERFLDTFPSQWMQLENVLAATPDPQTHRLFSIDKDNPAGVQMVLEPLLLFDAVFIEDRPLVELLTPEFAYQSDFLKTWYTTDLKPPAVNLQQIAEENRAREEKLKALTLAVKTTQAELAALTEPVTARLLEERKKNVGEKKPVDLKPFAAWEFNGDLKSSVNSLDLEATGKIEFEDGLVVLNKSHLISPKLPIELKAKSLEVWCKLQDLDQNGGGLMGIQGPGDLFDTIVLGERKSRHWISGSNGFSRTEDFPDSTAEDAIDQMLHLVMVYQEDGTTTLYRNGLAYGKPYKKGVAPYPPGNSSVIFGLRHLPPVDGRFLSVKIDLARLYDRALTAAEVVASHSGENLYVSDKELLLALQPEQREKVLSLRTTSEKVTIALKNVPAPLDPQKLQQESAQRFDNEIRRKLRERIFERVAASDSRYGGVITNAAMLSMTSGPKRTHPIARGAWIIEVIFNDPPPPPPNDIPPLNEENGSDKLTIREKFALHRENPDCAGCHSRLDPLGFAMENFDITGRWRDKYANGRNVDSSGRLMKKYDFEGIVQFKESLAQEEKRFARAFTAHMLRFALATKLSPADSLTVEAILHETEDEGFRIKSLIKEVILSDRFSQRNGR
jgi:hypothetical protein